MITNSLQTSIYLLSLVLFLIKEVKFAWVLDNLKLQWQKDITIDVSFKSFTTLKILSRNWCLVIVTW